MEFLSRESAPFGAEIWQQIDGAVVDTARRTLVGRRFLHVFGPLGAGALSIHTDGPQKAEAEDSGLIRTNGRAYQEIPQLVEDFTLLWRDMENSRAMGYPLDLTAAVNAAHTAAKREDHLIFFGHKGFGYEGLLSAQGVNKLKKGDWKEGENAFTDIAAAITLLIEKGITGRYVLALSPDLYLQMQRIQPGTGLLELERVSKLLDGHVYQSSVLGMGKAVLVCSEPQYMDLVIGQDLSTAYLEQKDLNHVLRVMETVLPRIKRKDAVVVFE